MAVLPTGIGPVTGYNIERSLRFNSADSAYLNRTPASAGNRRTFTWSGWVKRSKLGISAQLFSTPYASAGANSTYLAFGSTDGISFSSVQSTNQFSLATSQVFRDVSAWYHIVAVCDTTNATSSDRVRLYINGERVTAFGVATYPSQNYESYVNSTVVHNIGRLNLDGGTSQLFDGYMTEINFIDGQALTPSSFGETDTNTGVWKPKAYTGTYGTNGFFLKFADNSNTTAATLGKDSSGNGNNWTPNNFSVTAGVGNDSLVDTPTNYGTDTGVGGEVRGNYCTLNPLDKGANASTLPSNGNLDFTLVSASGGGPQAQQCATFGVSTGKWYWEVSFSNISAGGQVGIILNTWPMASNPFTASSGIWYAYQDNGNKNNGSTASSYGASYTTNDVIGVALDMDAGTITFYKNGASQGQAFSGISGTFKPHLYVSSSGATSAGSSNFGQRAFAYTAPSGFKALCTQNLPTPTIGATSTTQANDYMNVVLYSGNSSTQAITGVGFQPDFVWCKARSTAAHHIVTDAVRTAAKVLSTSQTAAESAWADNAFFQSLNSDGFTLTGGGTGINTTGNTYVAWNWKANGAGSSNTAGTITSTVSANTTSGFSIVTYTGNGTANATIGHGLGVTPAFIITKSRSDATTQWVAWHKDLSGAFSTTCAYIYLNSTQLASTTTIFYNGTLIDSSKIGLQGTNTSINNTGSTYVAYCFAPVAGYSAFGSYTGNGSTDGPFVYTGFRPRWIMVKRSDTAGASWLMNDSSRDVYNVTGNDIYANLSNAEVNEAPIFDFLSNGFKCRSAGGNQTNANGGTYIYAAFAESPFKYSLAR